MEFARTIDIDAPPQRIWEILADVEHWPDWTESMQKVERLDRGQFGMGSRARVKQPRLMPATFAVTSFEPGTSFEWTSKTFGVVSVGDHRIEPRDGGARVTVSFSMRGPMAWLGSTIASGLIRRYVTMEAEGLKKQSEAGSANQP